ncbi:MAG: hypothetical protein RL092_1575 [Bacteroidota bacterium]
MDPLMCKYTAFTPFCFAANSTILFVDVDGRDWFVNSRTGQVVYVKQESKLNQEVCDRLGMNLPNPNDYVNVGGDYMFGEKVKFSGRTGNVDEWAGGQKAIILDGSVFLDDQGYAVTEKYSITESYSNYPALQGESQGASSSNRFDKYKHGPAIEKKEEVGKRKNVSESKMVSVDVQAYYSKYDISVKFNEDVQKYAELPGNKLAGDYDGITTSGLKILSDIVKFIFN